jgi:hypothetical protein
VNTEDKNLSPEFTFSESLENYLSVDIYISNAEQLSKGGNAEKKGCCFFLPAHF